MGYPQRQLNDDESVALDMHPHWWFFAESVAALAVSLVTAVVVMGYLDDGAGKDVLTYVVLAMLIVSGCWVALRYLKWSTTHFVITSQRLIFRQGVLGRSGIEIPLDRVNNVNFHQTMFERIINAGDLLIESGGEDGKQRFTDVHNPDDVQNLIHSLLTDARDRQTGGRGALTHDVTMQLERLEALLERGAITDDEYELQKRRLLS
ncbi:MAG: PH domain-containing protein [Ilumatobacteraceae bacterium]